MTDVRAILTGANEDFQPAAGVEWEIQAIGCSVWVGAPPNAVPQLNVGIFDGALGPSWLMRSVDLRGWSRDLKLAINNDYYLRVQNPGGATVNASISGVQMRAFAPGASILVTEIQTVLAAASYDFQPPVGEEQLVYDVGSSMWIGAAPNGLPDVTVSITDGTLFAAVLTGANARGWNKTLALYLNRTNYLRVTNTNAGPADIAIVGIVARRFGTAASLVQTDVQAIGAGANLDLQPAASDEYMVTDFGAGVPGTWVGIAPAAYPNITVDIYDGTLASRVLDPANDRGWSVPMRLFIDNSNYLRINDAGGAGQSIAISAVQTREFAP